MSNTALFVQNFLQVLHECGWISVDIFGLVRARLSALLNSSIHENIPAVMDCSSNIMILMKVNVLCMWMDY